MTSLADQTRLLSRILALHAALPMVLTSEQFQAVFWVHEVVHDGYAETVSPYLWVGLMDAAQLLEAEWSRRQDAFVRLLAERSVDCEPLFQDARLVRAQLAAAPQVVRT